MSPVVQGEGWRGVEVWGVMLSGAESKHSAAPCLSPLSPILSIDVRCTCDTRPFRERPPPRTLVA